MRPFVHIVLHFLVPLVAARVFFSKRWKQAWLIMVATMVIDVDHLLADPLYDPNRCSIGFHPLHTAPAAVGYVGLTLLPVTRIVGLGLLIHLALDGLDCVWLRFE